MSDSLYTQLEDAVRAVALIANTNNSSTPIIFSHQPGSEPATSYIVINVLAIDQIGGSSISALLNKNNKTDVRVVYEALVQFSFYGPASGKISNDFYHLLNSPSALEAMSKENIALMRKTRLRRNPQRRETQWIDSFNFDTTFNYIVNTPVTAVPIEHVVIEEQYAGNRVTTIPPFPQTP